MSSSNQVQFSYPCRKGLRYFCSVGLASPVLVFWAIPSFRWTVVFQEGPLCFHARADWCLLLFLEGGVGVLLSFRHSRKGLERRFQEDGNPPNPVSFHACKEALKPLTWLLLETFVSHFCLLRFSGWSFQIQLRSSPTKVQQVNHCNLPSPSAFHTREGCFNPVRT